MLNHCSSSLPYHRIGDLHIHKILGHLDFMLWEKEVVSFFFSEKDHKEKIHSTGITIFSLNIVYSVALR